MGKTINIYLNSQERKLVDDLKVKYQLSLTTIVDILVMVTMKVFLMTNDKEKVDHLKNEYLYTPGRKTSIKQPKIFSDKELFAKEQHKSRFATNVIMLYIKKDIKNYVNQEQANKYWNECNSRLTTTKDQFWNYNTHIRMQRRMLRENKEYFKKALEEN